MAWKFSWPNSRRRSNVKEYEALFDGMDVIVALRANVLTES